jgi:A/G-specific adenine glycosylase
MPSRRPPKRQTLQFKRRLLRWFRAEGRRLPWRETRDPYAVLVSEFMLQQTQVTRVMEYYDRFLARFPTVYRLARARPAQVRDAWEGLGYYRQAESLHRLAKTVVAEYAGHVPDTPKQLSGLPGIGPYTAGAVASFAYERRVPAVDTNAARVLARAFLPTIEGSRTLRRLTQLASDLLPTRGRTAWEFNQALMDLGSTYCTARKPKCAACPVRPACRTGKRRAAGADH